MDCFACRHHKLTLNILSMRLIQVKGLPSFFLEDIRSSYLMFVYSLCCNIFSGKDIDWNSLRNVHVAANLLKKYFQKLPEPLLTFDLWETFTGVIKTQENNTTLRVEALKKAVLIMPEGNRNLLYRLAKLCRKISDNSETNKMNITNLSTVIGPNLLYPKTTRNSLMLSDMTSANAVVENILENFSEIFADEIAKDAAEPQEASALDIPRISVDLSPTLQEHQANEVEEVESDKEKLEKKLKACGSRSFRHKRLYNASMLRRSVSLQNLLDENAVAAAMAASASAASSSSSAAQVADGSVSPRSAASHLKEMEKGLLRKLRLSGAKESKEKGEEPLKKRGIGDTGIRKFKEVREQWKKRESVLLTHSPTANNKDE